MSFMKKSNFEIDQMSEKRSKSSTSAINKKSSQKTSSA